jgi:hypothetical protein
MIIQLHLLSGRARLGSLLRHFSHQNDGICELYHLEIEYLTYFLLPRCPLLHERAEVLLTYMQTVLMGSEACSTLLKNILLACKEDSNLWVQFVLDCSVLPPVITASQSQPQSQSLSLVPPLQGHKNLVLQSSQHKTEDSGKMVSLTCFYILYWSICKL